MRERPVAIAKIAVFTLSRRRGRGALAAIGSSDTGGYSTRAPRRNCRGFCLLKAMANIHSQKKRIQRAARERLENRRYTSKIRTYFRRLETAVAGGDDAAADSEHRVLVQTIDKAVKRGAIHRNTGARKKSRAAQLRRGGEAG
jgi:small subunit ribosomal protein S20